MVFYWNLSDSNLLQDSSKYFSRSWQCCGPDSFSSNLQFLKSFRDFSKGPSYDFVSVSLECSHSFFNSLARFRYLSSFLPFSFTLLCWHSKICYMTDSFPLWIKIRSDLLACMGWYVFYLKIPENFMHFIFKDRFWFVFIPFVNMVKFQFLVLFPVDHLPILVMPIYSFSAS